VSLQVERVRELMEKKGIHLEVTDDAKDWLAKLGYDPMFGARPLKRVIQKHAVNPLSEQILKGDLNEGDTVVVGLDVHGLIEFSRKKE
jgi:ATP-dependent Clp protease ATP-binding subunit ClpA